MPWSSLLPLPSSVALCTGKNSSLSGPATATGAWLFSGITDVKEGKGEKREGKQKGRGKRRRKERRKWREEEGRRGGREGKKKEGGEEGKGMEEEGRRGGEREERNQGGSKQGQEGRKSAGRRRKRDRNQGAQLALFCLQPRCLAQCLLHSTCRQHFTCVGETWVQFPWTHMVALNGL